MNIINYSKEKMRLSNTETLEVIENRKDYRTIIEKFKKLEFKKSLLPKNINNNNEHINKLYDMFGDINEDLDLVWGLEILENEEFLILTLNNLMQLKFLKSEKTLSLYLGEEEEIKYIYKFENMFYCDYTQYLSLALLEYDLLITFDECDDEILQNFIVLIYNYLYIEQTKVSFIKPNNYL